AQRGLTEDQLATLFIVSKQTVKDWEAGEPAEGEPWRRGTHIEAAVGALLHKWISDGVPPDAAALGKWKSSVDARKRVVPGTYEVIDGGEALPWHATLTSIAKGFAEAQDIIFFVFVVGGVIGIVRATGAIDALIGSAINAFSGK